MKAWVDQPREEAFLFNPPFCGLLLATAVAEYGPMAVPLSFLVLPTVLHKRTRDALPRTTRTTFATWVQQHAESRVLFAERTSSLKPHTRRGLVFAMNQSWLFSESEGRLTASTEIDLYQQGTRVLSDEAKECLRQARFVGRWFARAGDPATVMALWGVRP